MRIPLGRCFCEPYFDLHLDSAADFLSTRREFRDEYPSEQADRDAEASLR
jgi:hypothetical protein